MVSCFLSPTQSFIYLIEAKHPRCIPVPTLASHRICHSAENKRAGCQSDKDYVSKLLDTKNQPKNPAFEATSMQEKAPKRLDVSKLNQDSMRQAFLMDICNQVDAINLSSEDPKENWTVFH